MLKLGVELVNEQVAFDHIHGQLGDNLVMIRPTLDTQLDDVFGCTYWKLY